MLVKLQKSIVELKNFIRLYSENIVRYIRTYEAKYIEYLAVYSSKGTATI